MSIEVYDNFLPTEVFNPIKEYIFGAVSYTHLTLPTKA